MYSEDYRYTERRRERQKQRALLRRRKRQRAGLILLGVIIAATIIVVAATTGTKKQPASAPVELIPPTISQEETRSIYVSTSTPTVETTSEPLPEPTEPAIPTFNVKLAVSLQELTYQTCAEYQIEDYYQLVLALMWVESRYDTQAISRTNDYGLMQINKGNYKWLREELGISDFLDAQDNITAGVYMLSGYLLKYEDVHKALMAYNMGASRASQYWKQGTYTSSYSRKVVAAWEELKATQTITE